MSPATADTTLADLVTQRPGRSRVFESLGLDYCCNGGQSLEAACTKAGKDLDEVLARLTEFDATAGGEDEPDFGSMDLTTLTEHIVATHHAYLWEEMEPLAALVEKVTRVHGQKFPWLVELRRMVLDLFMELDAHLRKEEEVLFPMIQALEAGQPSPTAHCSSIEMPIHVMEIEHDAAGDQLILLRRTAQDYAVPEDACNSFRAMMNRLEALEYDLHRHIHKENSLLHPKALMLAGKA